MFDQNLPVPTDGALMTVMLVVDDPARSRDFYSKVLGGTVVRTHAPTLVRLHNAWIIIRPGSIQERSFAMIMLAGNAYPHPMALNIQVNDIQAVVQEVAERGGQFVTPLIDLGCELRCYMRDPDGYLIEFEQIIKASQPFWKN